MLTSNTIVLEPLQEKHHVELAAAAQDESIWTLLPEKNFDRWFEKALEKNTNEQQLPFVVRNKIDRKIIGTTRYYQIEEKHKRLSIGYTWYVSSARGTAVNPECKFLLLNNAFEALQMNRVEFVVDSRNLQSQNAVKKLGAKQEGVLRQHMILPDGYIRDSVIFSIVSVEWPEVKAQLQDRLKILLKI